MTHNREFDTMFSPNSFNFKANMVAKSTLQPTFVNNESLYDSNYHNLIVVENENDCDISQELIDKAVEKYFENNDIPVGITEYPDLKSKPKINGVELVGNKTAKDLKLQPAGDYLSSIPEDYVRQEDLDNYVQKDEIKDIEIELPDWIGNEKPVYTAEEVGAITTTDAQEMITNHDLSSNAHTDIRNSIKDVINNKADKNSIPTTLPASDVYDWAKQPNKPIYTAIEVGAEVSGATDDKISTHNSSSTAHEDIRALISDIQIPELPKNISEFNNDAGYITEVPNEYITDQELKNYNYAHKDDIPEVSVLSVNGQTGNIYLDADSVGALSNTTHIPTSTGELVNNSGFITYTVNDLTNYYLKSETYTQDEIKQLIGTIPKFSIQPVDILPVDNIDAFTVYLLKTGEDTENLYTEYIYVNNTWERLGVQTIDLTGYALVTDIPTTLSSLTNDMGFITNTVIDLVNYYKKNEVYNKDEIDGKGFLTQHQDLSTYAKKSDIPTALSELNDDVGYLTEHQDLSAYAKKDEVPVVSEWALQLTKPSYTVDEVGADAFGSASQALIDAKIHSGQQIVEHNTDVESHSDIRLLIKELADRLNALADSDDTTLDQLSEVVAYIKSNKALIDAITTNKISYSDIVDNLTTNISDKPLSAAQGVILKALFDSIKVPTKVSELENDKNYLTEHQDISGKLDASKLPEAINTALEQAKNSGEFDGEDGTTPVKGTDYFTATDKASLVSEIAKSIPSGGTNAVTLNTAQTISAVKTFVGSNLFDGEQKLTFEQYCPVVTDIASGIGASMKNARAVDCQLYVAEIYAPYWASSITHGGKEPVSGLTANVGQIDFYIVTGAASGQPTGRKLIMQMKEDGLYVLGKKVVTQ